MAQVCRGHWCVAPGAQKPGQVTGRRSQRAGPRGPAGGKQWSSLKQTCGPWLGSREVSRAHLDLVQTHCPTFCGKLEAECQEPRPLAGPHEAHGCVSTWAHLGSAGEHALALLCAT